MQRRAMWAACLAATLLATSFMDQVSCQSSVEVGGTATSGGSTSAASSTTETTTTIQTSGQEVSTETSEKDSPPPPPPPPPPPAAALESKSADPAASGGAASAVASTSPGGTTSTFSSISQSKDGATTATSGTMEPAAVASSESKAEDTADSAGEDNLEMPSADEEISSRTGDDLDDTLDYTLEDAEEGEGGEGEGDDDNEAEEVDPSKLPVCEGIPKFICCDDQDFVTANGKTFCGCWGSSIDQGCNYGVDKSSSPIVIEDLRTAFGGGKCRCKEPEEVLADECFGRTKSSCCDNVDPKAEKCRCLFGTDRCIYKKGKNGVWHNTLFSSGDCVCPGN